MRFPTNCGRGLSRLLLAIQRILVADRAEVSGVGATSLMIVEVDVTGDPDLDHVEGNPKRAMGTVRPPVGTEDPSVEICPETWRRNRNNSMRSAAVSDTSEPPATASIQRHTSPTHLARELSTTKTSAATSAIVLPISTTR